MGKDCDKKKTLINSIIFSIFPQVNNFPVLTYTSGWRKQGSGDQVGPRLQQASTTGQPRLTNVHNE